jgi:hypothetical protein
MPSIDIEVDADLKKLFELPPCEEIRLPQPKPLKIQLPTGGSLSAVSDIARGIPNDCSLSFNLLAQLGPFLASIECLLKVLKLLKPLIDIVNGLPVPPVKAIQKFAKAAVDLAPCLLVPTPANMIPFIRDILCLILKLLKCFLGQMKTILAMMSGLQLRLDAALASGNAELAHALQCAQENASLSAQHLTQSVEPIKVLLELLGPFFGIAGVQPIQLPALGSAADVESLNQVVQTVQTVVATIQIVVDALGGCP